MEKRVTSFGYAGKTPEQLLYHVRSSDSVVVDCRLKPFSMNRSWSKKALAEFFRERYVWVEELGNLNYKGSYGTGIKLKNAELGISKVMKLLEEKEVILMCMCSLFEKCHVKRIVDMLEVSHDIPHQRL